MSIFSSSFLKYFVRKKWRDGGDSLLKMVQKMVTLTKHVFPGLNLHYAGPLALWGFLQHLSTKFKCSSKKVLLSERGARHCAIRQIRRLLLHYVHKKFT